MRKLLAVAAVAVLFGCEDREGRQTDLGVGGSGPSEPTAQQPSPPAGIETRPFTGDQANIAGRVESVEQGSLVLLEDSGQRTTVAVHPQTQVIIDGQAASLEQIQEGSQVRASFDPSTDQNTPGRIEIQTMGQGQQQPAPQQQY